ncbi:PrsW family intramembrane metalloprotease [Pendulispora albinea]|uniref:PrsW family intramembrane metalloprotease n=1 Tax=Pendulispora albinea TaxID=2741071 RepID=A0ABZ2LQQ4_9BACT
MVLSFLRWFVPAVLPAVLLAIGVYRSDDEREPIWLVSLVFVLGGVFGGLSFLIENRAAAWTGLDIRASVSGQAGSLLFLFAVVAPVREAAKVSAAWVAFRTRHFDEPYDGLVYASAAAVGFAAVENAILLRAHPDGGIWLARAAFAFPAHLFFACAWGYALGRSRQLKTPGTMFPVTWFGAMVAHGLYIHFVYGRGPGALIAAAPLLVVMAVVAWIAARDLRNRTTDDDAPVSSLPISSDHRPRISFVPLDALSHPPSLRAVREALRRSEQPVKLRWIAFGALVTLGAMLVGLAAAIAFGNWAHVDFSLVDEHRVSTTAPVALMGAGLLSAFPVSGYLVARASNAPTLLEPALATALALLATLLLLGLAAPVALVFALAFSPVAWGLACAGAWVGRVAKSGA